MKNKISSMLKLQDKLNLATCGAGYKSGKTAQGKVINYARCIYQEACELESSLPWKHWKNTTEPADYANAKIELIDIWHFIMSLALMQGELDALSLDVPASAASTGAGFDDAQILARAQELIHEASAPRPSCAKLCEIFAALCELLGLSADELYKIYVGKNVLNIFRQEHGYKEGSYRKIWNGEEDNVVMSRLLESGASADEIYEKLKEIYEGLK